MKKTVSGAYILHKIPLTYTPELLNKNTSMIFEMITIKMKIAHIFMSLLKDCILN